MAAKVFEVGDVLPATTNLQITFIHEWGSLGSIKSDNNEFVIVEWDTDSMAYLYILGENKSYDSAYMSENYYSIDTSNWSLSKRTISKSSVSYKVFWEDLAPTPSGYSITFEENGGTTISDIEEATELPTPLPTTTKPGYTFGGWYYESNFQTRAKAGDTIEANTTLYAKWLTLAQVIEHINNVVEELRSAIIDKGGDAEGKLLIDFATIINSLKTYEVVETLAELELLEPTLNRVVYVVEGSGELTMGAPVKVTQDGDTLIIG